MGKISTDSLIVIDDVSGIADTSKKFAEFLTVFRKYRYQYIYVFRIITPETQIWKKIISQTNFFNIFPSRVPYSTVAKILHSKCRQATKIYIPAQSMWLNRVFTDFAITHKRYCLTIDSSGVNKNGNVRYRTQADDREKTGLLF